MREAAPWLLAHDPRTRYLVAHELAHTLFYRWEARTAVRTCVQSEAEERFCDIFASTLLDLDKDGIWSETSGPSGRTANAEDGLVHEPP